MTPVRLAPTGTPALLYCTFNGAANCTNGIGRQTQTLLGALERRWDQLTARTGTFTPYLAIPEPGPATWAYDPDRLATTRAVIKRRGGTVISLPYDTTAGFWSVPVWQQLSTQAAGAARRLAARHSHVAVIAVDTPFAGTGRAHLDTGPRPAGSTAISILLTLYGTARLHHPGNPEPAQLGWEQHALTAAGHADVTVADIGTAFTTHLRTDYHVNDADLISYRCSLDLTDPDLHPMPADEAHRIAAAYHVPLDRPIILAVGRTDPVKGFDQLVAALAPLADLIHLVAVIVSSDGPDPLRRAYQQQIADAGLRATYIDQFSRDLPRALASLPNTAAVACPSRSETFANLPLEVALWARHHGPIVVAPDLGGFPETITHGSTGLLYDPHMPGALTDAIRDTLQLPAAARVRMRRRAYERVIRERDVVAAYTDTLGRVLP